MHLGSVETNQQTINSLGFLQSVAPKQPVSSMHWEEQSVGPANPDPIKTVWTGTVFKFKIR